MQELYKILALSLALGTGITASHTPLAEIEKEQKREASNHHELMEKFNEMEEHLSHKGKKCTNHYSATASHCYVDFRVRKLLELTKEVVKKQHKLEKWQLKLDKQLSSLVGPKGSMTADIAALKDACGLDESNSHVLFRFTAQGVTTEFGEDVYVVGNTPELGSWDHKKAVKLSRNNNLHTTADWSVMINLPRKKNFEYKFIIKGKSSTTPVAWMAGENLTINTGAQRWATTLGVFK